MSHLVKDEKFYARVYEDFGKSRKDVEEYVAILLNWAKEQPHFPELPQINFCTFCIVACKFSLEKSKQKIDMYYAIRNLMPEIYTMHPLSPEMILQNKVIYCVVLPKATPNHETIIYLQINPKYGPDDFKLELMVVQFTHLIELVMQEQNYYNWHFIFDWAGAKLGHVTKFNPMVVRKFFTCFEKVYASRLATNYIVNFYPFIENIFNTIFLPLMPEKLRSRIKTCRNTDILFEDFGRSMLPKDIGGDEKSLEELREDLMKKYEESKPRFDKIQYMVSNESLRPTKLQNDDILGYYGSFKEISVD